MSRFADSVRNLPLVPAGWMISMVPGAKQALAEMVERDRLALIERMTVRPDPPVSPEQRAATVREACTGLRIDA